MRLPDLRIRPRKRCSEYKRFGPACAYAKRHSLPVVTIGRHPSSGTKPRSHCHDCNAIRCHCGQPACASRECHSFCALQIAEPLPGTVINRQQSAETQPEMCAENLWGQGVLIMSSPPVTPWIRSQAASSDEQLMIQLSPMRRTDVPLVLSWRAAAFVWTSSGS